MNCAVVTFNAVLAPPGVGMVAPPEAPRNAEGAQGEGRVVEEVKWETTRPTMQAL